MARPLKKGLEYFPLDIDIFDDPKLLFVSEKFGDMGELVAVKLLTWIYRNGYYIDWNDEMAVIFSSRAFREMKSDFVISVVDELIERRFFNRKKYKNYGILTSEGIQKRWMNVIKRSKRNAIITSRFNLVSSEETPLTSEETPAIEEETPLKAEESTQSKVKESKVKKSIVKKSVKSERKPAHKLPANEPETKTNPTLNEVKEFAENERIDVKIATQFFNYYEAQGWITGGSANLPIVNWMMKLREWNLNESKGKRNADSKGSVKSRLDYEFDPEEYKRREAELKKRYG